MCDRTGWCGSFSRLLLVSVNVISLLLYSISFYCVISIKNGYFNANPGDESVKQIEFYMVIAILYMIFLVLVTIFVSSLGCCVNKVGLIFYGCIAGAHLVILSIVALVKIFSEPNHRFFIFNSKHYKEYVEFYWEDFHWLLKLNIWLWEFNITLYMVIIDVLVAFISVIIILSSMNKRKKLLHQLEGCFIRADHLI